VCAALVAEKLGFEKAARDGSAVDFDESALASRAKIVNGAGDELLARAGFAGDENGGAGRSHDFDLRECALERRAVTDDFFKIEFTANFFLEIELFFGELVL
jgi:hypothetical protein